MGVQVQEVRDPVLLVLHKYNRVSGYLIWQLYFRKELEELGGRMCLDGKTGCTAFTLWPCLVYRIAVVLI